MFREMARRAAPASGRVHRGLWLMQADVVSSGTSDSPTPPTARQAAPPAAIIADSPAAILSDSPAAILADALDRIDTAIALLDAGLRAHFMNAAFRQLWSIPGSLAAARPRFADLARHVETTLWSALPAVERQAYLQAREAQIRAGAVPPTQIDLMDGRHLRFACQVLPDGGRVLTYLDVSDELRRGADAALEQVSAELRFANETLESQAAHLVALAESSDEAAQRAETARLLLEKEIEERRELEARLREVASTDGLTGVLNRAALIAAGERELERCRRNGAGLAVLMFDADHFKTVNDRFGHAGGDQTLRWLASASRNMVRGSDAIGRIGGEEFAIVLPGSSLEAAARIAERLRVEVAGRAAWLDQTPIFVTISIGVAVARATDQSIEQVLMRADAALYRAKNRGRNRVALEIEADGLILSADRHA